METDFVILIDFRLKVNFLISFLVKKQQPIIHNDNQEKTNPI